MDTKITVNDWMNRYYDELLRRQSMDKRDKNKHDDVIEAIFNCENVTPYAAGQYGMEDESDAD